MNCQLIIVDLTNGNPDALFVLHTGEDMSMIGDYQKSTFVHQYTYHSMYGVQDVKLVVVWDKHRPALKDGETVPEGEAILTKIFKQYEYAVDCRCLAVVHRNQYTVCTYAEKGRELDLPTTMEWLLVEPLERDPIV